MHDNMSDCGYHDFQPTITTVPLSKNKILNPTVSVSTIDCEIYYFKLLIIKNFPKDFFNWILWNASGSYRYCGHCKSFCCV